MFLKRQRKDHELYIIILSNIYHGQSTASRCSDEVHKILSPSIQCKQVCWIYFSSAAVSQWKLIEDDAGNCKSSIN